MSLEIPLELESQWQNTIGREVSSLKLNYKVFGKKVDGEFPVVLLHGWWNSLETVTPIAEILSNYFEVFVVDLPGHGKSEVPKEIWDMRGFASCLKKFLDEQSVSIANFVGHSFGGKTIIKFSNFYLRW